MIKRKKGECVKGETEVNGKIDTRGEERERESKGRVIKMKTKRDEMKERVKRCKLINKEN